MRLFRIATDDEKAEAAIEKELCFASKPAIGKPLQILYFDKEKGKVCKWETENVVKIERKIFKLIPIIYTENSMYTFLKFPFTVEKELENQLCINKRIRKAEAREIVLKNKDMTHAEILEWIHNLRNGNV